MKLYVGASGKEVVPNFGFWVDLPNLVLVRINFFKTHSSYYRQNICFRLSTAQENINIFTFIKFKTGYT